MRNLSAALVLGDASLSAHEDRKTEASQLTNPVTVDDDVSAAQSTVTSNATPMKIRQTLDIQGRFIKYSKLIKCKINLDFASSTDATSRYKVCFFQMF